MSEFLIDIHVPTRKAGIPTGKYHDEGLGNWGRPELALAIADRGITPVFSRGPDAYDLESGRVQVLRPRIENRNGDYTVNVYAQDVVLGSIRAIRNISKAIGGGVPELNHPDVRAAARDKAVSNQLFTEAGLLKSYATYSPGESLDSVLDRVNGSDVVIKPRNGMRSKNIWVGAKQDALAKAQDGGLGESEWIIEERLGLRAPMPLKGLRVEDQEKIDFVNNNQLPKEFRVYSFGRDDKDRLLTSFVMRAAKGGDTHLVDDEWVILDPESVPNDVIDKTDSVMRAFEDSTGVREIHAATDWVFATDSAHTDPTWFPMEINASEPQLVYEKEHGPTSREQTGLLADQLFRIGKSRSVKKIGEDV